MVVVYSSRFSGSETSLPMLMEHIFISQYEFYWKRHDLKNALKKENFLDKNLWHIMSFCTRRSDGWPPIRPVISKHAIFGVQSAWAAAYLADPMPSVHWRAVSLTKCRYNLPSPKLPSSGLMEFYVSQMVCVCIYSLYKIVHYTCNVEYTTRCVALPSDSSRPLLGHKTRLTTCTVHTTPPLCRACWQGSLPPL